MARYNDEHPDEIWCDRCNEYTDHSAEGHEPERAKCPSCGISTGPDQEGLSYEAQLCDRCYGQEYPQDDIAQEFLQDDITQEYPQDSITDFEGMDLPDKIVPEKVDFLQRLEKESALKAKCPRCGVPSEPDPEGMPGDGMLCDKCSADLIKSGIEDSPEVKKAAESPEEEPFAVQTEDGFVFIRQPNGSYTDGDMTFDSLDQLVEEDLDWVPLPEDDPRVKEIAINIEEKGLDEYEESRMDRSTEGIDYSGFRDVKNHPEPERKKVNLPPPPKRKGSFDADIPEEDKTCFRCHGTGIGPTGFSCEHCDGTGTDRGPEGEPNPEAEFSHGESGIINDGSNPFFHRESDRGDLRPYENEGTEDLDSDGGIRPFEKEGEEDMDSFADDDPENNRRIDRLDASRTAKMDPPDYQTESFSEVHNNDEDCTVGRNGVCTGCGVYHGEPCPHCSGRGYHNEGCPEIESGEGYREAFKDNDRIPGGLADEKTPSDFDPDDLAEGIKVELEHTSDETLAKEIASDHLSESPTYYKDLKKMEDKEKKGSVKYEAVCRDCGDYVLESGLPTEHEAYQAGIRHSLRNNHRTYARPTKESETEKKEKEARSTLEIGREVAALAQDIKIASKEKTANFDSYADAKEAMHNRPRKKINNHTYLELLDENEDIGLKLHDTYIIVFHKNGSFTLNSGGYKSVTTKARLNEYMPWGFSISTKKKVWTVSTPAGDFPFQDGITFNHSGKVQSKPEALKPGQEREDANMYFIDEVLPLVTSDLGALLKKYGVKRYGAGRTDYVRLAYTLDISGNDDQHSRIVMYVENYDEITVELNDLYGHQQDGDAVGIMWEPESDAKNVLDTLEHMLSQRFQPVKPLTEFEGYELPKEITPERVDFLNRLKRESE